MAAPAPTPAPAVPIPIQLWVLLRPMNRRKVSSDECMKDILVTNSLETRTFAELLDSKFDLTPDSYHAYLADLPATGLLEPLAVSLAIGWQPLRKRAINLVDVERSFYARSITNIRGGFLTPKAAWDRTHGQLGVDRFYIIVHTSLKSSEITPGFRKASAAHMRIASLKHEHPATVEGTALASDELPRSKRLRGGGECRGTQGRVFTAEWGRGAGRFATEDEKFASAEFERVLDLRLINLLQHLGQRQVNAAPANLVPYEEFYPAKNGEQISNIISAAVEAKVRACEAAVGVIFAGNVPVGSATLVGKRLAATCFHVPFKLSKVDDRIATAFLGTPKLRITWPCGETRLFGEKDVAFPLDPRDMGTDVALVELDEALSITPVQIEADVRLLDASNVPNEKERQRVWVLRGSVDDSRPIRLDEVLPVRTEKTVGRILGFRDYSVHYNNFTEVFWSGGAVVNDDGKLIAIHQASASPAYKYYNGGIRIDIWLWDTFGIGKGVPDEVALERQRKYAKLLWQLFPNDFYEPVVVME